MKKRKLGKRQQAIADKYAHILKGVQIREDNRGRQSKVRSLNRDIKRLGQEYKDTQDLLYDMRLRRVTGPSPRQTIDSLHETHNKLRMARDEMYQTKMDIRTSRGYIEVDGRIINLIEGELTDDQKSVLNSLQHELEMYSTGDMTITTFYHKYKFDVINETSLRLFAEGEGLI